MLKSCGFDSVTLVSDLAALRRQQTSLRHDLIIADGELSSLDGSDLLMLARADPLLAPALFVIVTEDTSFRFYERCMRRGADAVVYKPLATADLADAVLRLLASKRAWRGKVVPHPSSLPRPASRDDRGEGPPSWNSPPI